MRKILYGPGPGQGHRASFVYLGPASDIERGLLSQLKRREDIVQAMAYQSQVVRELRVCRRDTGGYAEPTYLVRTHYLPIDGDYQKWLATEYAPEIEKTGLHISGISNTDNIMQTQVQIQVQIQTQTETTTVASAQQPLSCPRIETLEEFAAQWESYIGCDYLPSISISKNLTEILSRIMSKSTPIPMNVGEIYVVTIDTKQIILLTSVEFTHMLDKTLSKTQAPDNTLKPAYYTAKFLLGHHLSDREQLEALPYILNNKEKVMDLITIIQGVIDAKPTRNWLYYYLFNPSVLMTEPRLAKILMAGLDDKERESILSNAVQDKMYLTRREEQWN